MSDVVGFMFSSGGLVVCAVACSVAWILRPGSRRPPLVLLTISLLYFLASLPPVATLAGRLLLVGRVPFSPADAPRSGRTALVVLGSGSMTARDWETNPYSTVDAPAAARVLEAWRVYRAVNPAWVISSGGHVHADDPAVPTGESMRDALVQLGVPRDRIVVETLSHNTRDEAVVVAPMLRSLQVDSVVLVTSDTHMLRSLCTFRAAGVDSIPAIARNPDADAPRRSRIGPSDRGLKASAAVAHEIFGLVYYTVRGWCRF